MGVASLRNDLEGGFTLIELMVVVAILGVLSAVAIPQYSNYVIKSKLSTVLRSIASVKTAVSVCAQEDNGSFTGCESGKKNVPPSFAVKEFASVKVSAGEITVTLVGGVGSGVDGGEIKIQPNTDGMFTSWKMSYTGIDNTVAQEYLKKYN